MREQAYQNIQNYTPQEKAEYDKMNTGCWLIIIVIVIIAAIIVYSISGEKGLRNFMK